MADESDVANALVTAIAAACYPAGTAAASVTGQSIKVYRGFPQASALDADLLAQRINVTVNSRAGMARNTTRWMPYDVAFPATAPGTTTTVSGSTVTFGGTPAAGDLVGIGVRRNGYAYAVQAGDTAATIAAYFGGLFGVTPSNTSVTVPTNATVSADAVTTGSSSRETRRTEQGFTVTVWAYDYPSRDAAAKAIDTALSDTPFVSLADGSLARLRWAQTMTMDRAENANLYRRDLIYMAEYGTLIVSANPRALFVGADITVPQLGGVTFQPDIASGNTYPPVDLDSAGQDVLDGNGNPIFDSFDL